MVTVYGLYPGIVAVAADADLHCIDCACKYYGQQIMGVVDSTPDGAEASTDHEGNPFTVVLQGSEDAAGQYCGDCREPLFDEEYARQCRAWDEWAWERG